MKILVTGSNGFVGGSFARFAAREGHEVTGTGRASQPEVGWPGSYAQADVASSDLSELVGSVAPDVVMHAAGTASVSASLKTPLDDLRAAVLTWANVLDSVRRSGARPLMLFASSAAVYGNPCVLPVSEDAPTLPVSPYGFHKAACELLAREYADCFGMRVVICRLFSVFGEAQRRLLIWELYEQLAGSAPVVWLEGTGEETRDYLHIDDAAAAMLELAEVFTRRGPDSSDACGCTTVNVASGEETRVSELAGQLRALVAPGKEVNFRGHARPGDPLRWQADITLLRERAPRWRPQLFQERLARCIAAWQKTSSSDA